MNYLKILPSVLIFLLAATVLISPDVAEAVGHEQAVTSDFIPVAILAGQSKAEVADALGSPEKCEKIKYGDKCAYKNGAVTIVFIGGKADWFTIHPKNALYHASSLSQLGLPTNIRPTFQNKHVLRWEMAPTLLEVALFPGAENTIFFIHVRARTP
ncbi:MULTISPECIES: hypothetical protein [unclassified Haematospirillum]|uniref:hypothetical protein n=1 Tax=unclassified Haematospirillum TaxID=2622088 RepID=UPI001438EA68|nr:MULTISPECIES: hypothetical protein [unclassified Haematospirillum]NKD55719.1 hypothetical protein [Haematospirillum sp. H4890]NKD75244.1 hypothetical protein [Haematospirillum sp. H4485]